MSGGYKFWANVAAALASASAGLAAAVPITEISQASPSVVKYTGADPANGNWVLLTVQGMVEVNRRIFRVAAVDAAANSFQLEGIDATAFKPFTSGSYQVINFDKSFSTLSEPSSSGGEPVFEDTTLIHSAADTRAIVSASPQSYGFVSVWDPTNPALIEANRAFVTKTPRCVLITFADGTKYAFSATIGAAMAPGAGGRKVVTPVSFELENLGTFFPN